MAVFIDKQSKIIIQGITGSVGRGFAKRMVQFGTPLVAGVSPNREGEIVHDVPVFNHVTTAVEQKKANTSIVIVPPIHVKEAVIEAIDAGIKTIVVYTEKVPIHDSMLMVQYAKLCDVHLFGPNSAGVVSVGQANVSDIHDEILVPGSVGVVSRSGTLTYEVIELLKRNSIGISTVVCLGGDPIIGVSQHEVLEQFEQDPLTKAVVYIGEIGGTEEVRAAAYMKKMTKPVFAYIAGNYAPKNKRMGHAGAIIKDEHETAIAKRKLLRKSGAIVVDVVTQLEKEIKKIDQL